MNEFAKRLREVRKYRSFSQEKLAEKADISRVMVSRYETGTVIPTVDVLISLADALNVSTDYLLGRCQQVPHLPDTQANLLPNVSKEEDDMPKNKEELRQFVLDVLKESILLKL